MRCAPPRGASSCLCGEFSRRLSLVPTQRFFVLMLTGAIAGAALIGLALPPARDALLYNHTPSVPVGFYVRTEASIARGAFVTVRAADVAPEAAHMRGFDEPRDRFIKRVAAAFDDRVCADGNYLIINDGAPIARRSHDHAGRALTRWSGCRSLGPNEVLLMGASEQSFDGRYWGPTDRRLIEGVWRPL